jgi:hypothetical protein
MTVLALNVGASAGPVGLLLVLLIGIATVLLIRNMDKRMRRLPKEFPPPPEPGPDRRL